MEKGFKVIQGGKAEQQEQKLTLVWFSYRKPDGTAVGEFSPITLAEDGKVDLSAVPDEKLRESWETLGVPDEYGFERVKPNEGERFLRCLLKLNGQTMILTRKV